MTIAEKKKRIEEATNKIYLGDFHMSPTAWNCFDSSPRELVYYKAKVIEKTDRMEKGTLLHCLALERHNFDKKFKVLPYGILVPGSRQGKELAERIAKGADFEESYIELYSTKNETEKKTKEKIAKTKEELGEYIGFLSNLDGRTIVKQADFDRYEFIVDQAYLDPKVRYAMEQQGECEKRINWSFGGYKHIGVVDKINDRFIWDVKLMGRGAGKQKVERSIYSMNLPLLAVMYLYGTYSLGDRVFQWIVFDENGNCGLHTLSDHDSYVYFRHYQFLANKLDQARIEGRIMEGSNFWSNTADGSFYSTIPPWKERELFKL